MLLIGMLQLSLAPMLKFRVQQGFILLVLASSKNVLSSLVQRTIDPLHNKTRET